MENFYVVISKFYDGKRSVRIIDTYIEMTDYLKKFDKDIKEILVIQCFNGNHVEIIHKS